MIDEAVAAGARLERACELLGLTIRTVQRWRADRGGEDRRRGTDSTPHNKLSPREEKYIARLITSRRYRDLSPKQIIPLLADRGIYVASEATLYRLMHRVRLQRHRTPTRPRSPKPHAHRARGPLQVFS